MFSKIPIDLKAIPPEDINKEILRAAIATELDAVNLYEQMALMASDENIKKVFLNVAREEKTHIGEFQAMLLRTDEEQARELDAGWDEVEELIG